MVQDSQSTRSGNILPKVNEKTTNGPELRGGYYNDNNSTNIEIEYHIGPDGSSLYLLHMGTGESTITDSATDAELQVHNNFKDSKVTLFDLLVPVNTAA